MADQDPNRPDHAMADKPRRKAWFARVRWLLFLAVLIGMGIGLHFVLPPAPRWTIAAQNGHVSRDGKILTTYMSDMKRIAKGPLQTWDTSTGRLLGSIPDDSPFFFGSELSRGGGSLFFPLRYFAVVLDDKRVAFGDIQTGREWIITLPTKKPDSFPSDKRWLTRADLVYPLRDHFVFQEGETSDGNPIQYHVVEASTGNLSATLSGYAFPGQNCYYSNRSNVKEDELICYFAPAKDGPLLTVFSIKERRIVQSLPNLKWTPTVEPSPSPYHYCLVSGGNEFLAKNRIGDSPLFRWDFWNLQTGACRSVTCESEQFPEVALNGLTYAFLTSNWALPLLGASTVGLMASPLADGQVLAASVLLAGGIPNCIELWDANKLQRRATVPAPGLADIKFSADSRVMGVAMDGDPVSFSLWNVETGSRLWEERVDGAEPPELLFSPDSQFVMRRNPGLELEVRESVSGKVHWNISLMELEVTDGVDRVDTAGEYVAYGSDRHRNGAPNTLEEWLGAWYPFPKWRNADGIVMVGHIATKKEICRLRTDPLLHVHYLSPDGRTLITSCGNTATNHVFQAWELPLRPRWGWVLGAPAALLAFVLLMKRLFAWRGRKRTLIPCTPLS